VNFKVQKCRGQGLAALVFFTPPIIFTEETAFAIQGVLIVKPVTLCFCVLVPFAGQPRNKYKLV
jgi:hypothetical protein